jgi:multiple sugar transport system permease protein
MLVSSLKPGTQILRDTASLRAFLPVGDLSNYNFRSAFSRAPVGRFLFNSMLVTSLTVIMGLLVNSIAAFSLVFLRWRGKNLLLTVIVSTLIVPFETLAIPLLYIVSNLPWIGPEGVSIGWQNSFHVQIIPFIANAFSIFLFVQFFRSLPFDLIEAARIDGASWFEIYRRVVMPLSGSVISTVAILTSLPMWNQYLWPVMVIQLDTYRPVMVGAGYFMRLGDQMAYLTTITLPVLILFFAMQHSFIESIAASGSKG